MKPLQTTINCCSSLLVIAMAGASYADNEFSAAISTGYDSNPLKSSLNEDGGFASKLELDYEGTHSLNRRNKLFLDIKGETDRYESALNDGDKSKAELETGVAFKYRRKFKAKLGTGYLLKRSTYTDRRTGLVATANGGEIGNRFDSNTAKLFADMSYKAHSALKLELSLQYKDRDYRDDYETLGLESLDYKQWNIEPGLEYDLTKTLEVSLSIPYGERQYDTRLSRTASGVSVAGEELEYRYQGYDLSFTYKPNKQWTLSAGQNFSDREDLFDGYKDLEKTRNFLAVKYRPSSTDELSFRSAFTENDFSNQPDINNVRDLSDVTSYRLKYVHGFNNGPLGKIELFSEVEVTTRDHDNPELEYDRDHFMLGLNKAF